MCMKWSVLVCEKTCYKDGLCFQLVLDVCEGLVPRRKTFWFVAAAVLSISSSARCETNPSLLPSVLWRFPLTGEGAWRKAASSAR